MWFHLGRDGFMTALQTDLPARVDVNRNDDLVVVMESIRSAARELGIPDVRVFLERADLVDSDVIPSLVLRVHVREDSYDPNAPLPTLGEWNANT